MKNLTRFSQSDRNFFLEKRLACFAPEAEKAPEAEPIKDKTPEQIKAIVISAREDVDTQIKKMEARFALREEDKNTSPGEIGAKKKLDPDKPQDKVMLDAYAKLQQQYKNLDKAVIGNISRNKEVISRTLNEVDTIFAVLDQNKDAYQPLRGDPMEGLNTNFEPLIRRREVEFAAPAAAPAAPAATPGITETVDNEARLNQELVERLRTSDQPLDKREADGLKKLMGTKNRVETKSVDGDPVIMDLSTDGKYIRFQVAIAHNISERTATQAPSEGKVHFEVVKALDGSANVDGAQFSTPTEAQKTQKNLETYQQEFAKQVEYLQSEKCPVGTMVVMDMTDTVRDGKKIAVFHCVQKNADEKLQFVTMEQGYGEKEARRVGQPDVLNQDELANLALHNSVTAALSPIVMEFPEFTEREVNRKIDSLADNIAGATVFGTDSEIFRNLVAELTTFSQKHNVPNYMFETDSPIPARVELAKNEVLVSRPASNEQKKDQPMQYAQIYPAEKKEQAV